MKITLLTGRTFNLKARLGLDIDVIRSSSAKRLTLRIDEKRHLPVLTIPQRCSEQKAYTFVDSHRDWITNMLARLPQTQKFTAGSDITILGQTYQIIHAPEERGGVFFRGQQLVVCGEAEFLHRRVTDFLKRLAYEMFFNASRQQAAKLGCQINNICVKDTKSRWGSCSTKNNINYNWRVILAPSYVFEYLVCHEVSHLVHPNHSAAFWQCVASLCPDWQEGRRWLKIKGKELYRYA